MKKILIILYSIGISFWGNAQEKISKDSIEYYLSSLDNASILIVHNHFDKLAMDEKAISICQNASEEVIQYLKKNLRDSSKTIICHVLLTKNLVLNKPGFKYEYKYSGQKIIETRYVYNNLSWVVCADGRMKVSPNEISRIREY